MVMVGAAAADVTSPAHRAIERRIPILIAFSSLNVGHHPTPAPRSGPDHRSLRAYHAARRGIGDQGPSLEPHRRLPPVRRATYGGPSWLGARWAGDPRRGRWGCRWRL